MAEEFVNSFEGCMNKDSNPIVQSKGTYTNMVNCNLVSQDGNRYVVKDCTGNLLTFTLNSVYIPSSYVEFANPPTPISFISFPDRLIVLLTNNETELGGYGEIGEIKYYPYGNGFQPKTVTGEFNSGYVPLYHHVNLLFSKMYMVDGFGFKESDLKQTIYWTDDKEQPRALNVSDPRLTNYISSGSLSAVNGTAYMVLEGAINYDGDSIDYGPGLSAGNVFYISVASNTYTDLNTPAPTAKVIEYIPVSLLDFNPKKTYGGIKFKEYGSGNLYCGDKIYLYRLSLISGYKSPWSYPSSPIHVGKYMDVAFTSTSNTYHKYAGSGNVTSAELSTYSVKVEVNNIDTDFDYIELACVEYDQLNEVPRLTSIVNVSDITGTEMVLTHDGSSNLGGLTLSDLTTLPSIVERIGSLASEKNYILAGKITEREELPFGVSIPSVTITSLQYPMNVYYDPLTCSNGPIYNDVSPVSGANPLATTIMPYTKYAVTTSGTIQYNGINYSQDQVFTGVAGVTSYTNITLTPNVRPCVTKNRYTPRGTTSRIEDYIELKGDTCFWDYKSAVISNHIASYWSGEKYRFGVVIYDKKGFPFYSRHIGDFTMPTIGAKGGLIITSTYAGATLYSLNPSIVKVSGLRIPKEVVERMGGFSIVRAKRDPRIVSQGLVIQTARDIGVTPNIIRPKAWIFPAADAHGTAQKIYSYICPDSLSNSPMPTRYLNVGDSMETAAWLTPIAYVGNAYNIAYAHEEQAVCKIITPLPLDTTISTRKITDSASLYENQFAGYGSDNLQNACFTETGPTARGAVVDTSCLSSGSGLLFNRVSIGGKKDIFSLDSDFPFYDVIGGSYCDGTADLYAIKVLMNNCIENINQYGGTGNEALSNTNYISIGHFQEIDSTVILNTCDTGNPNSYNYLEFNNIEIGGGDCFPSLIDYGYGLWDGSQPATFSYGWLFPCECNSNYGLRNGRKDTTVGMYYTGDTSAKSIVFYGASGEVRLEGFSYNKGYSTEGNQFLYPSLPANYITTANFPFTIKYAGPKIIGDTNDSWRTFLLNDTHVMNGSYGKINNIKVRDDRVIVWQDLATSTVPVLERQLISGLSGDVTTIGTGGVVNRHDAITSFYGNQHKWGLIETEYGFNWFDMRRRSYLVFDMSRGLINESLVGGLNGYFNQVFVELGTDVLDTTKLLNDPTFSQTSNRPLMGVGIVGVYDTKLKTTYMTFKFYNQKKVVVDEYIVDGYWSKDFTIGYIHNGNIKGFVGFFDINGAIYCNHNGMVISVNNPKNTSQWFPLGLGTANMSFVVGETYPLVTGEYLCIKDVILDSAEKYPGYPNSEYWALVNTPAQLWVNNQPTQLGQLIAPDYLYNKFFGKVVNNEIEFIINPNNGDMIEVLHLEDYTTSKVNYTDFYYDNDFQTASDLSVASTNRNFRFILNYITHNLPFSSTGRLVGSYLRVRYVKKNWTTDPRALVLGTKVLQYVKSFFVKKM